jgi:hypothetical protein
VQQLNTLQVEKKSPMIGLGNRTTRCDAFTVKEKIMAATTDSKRFAFEQLESRTLMSVAPMSSATHEPAPQIMPAVTTALARQTLASYIVGTWATTIGKTVYYRFEFSAKGAYLVQDTEKVYIAGVAHLATWKTLARGKWSVVGGAIEATTQTGLSRLYVYKESNKLAEFDVVSPNKTPPLRAVFARIA